MTIERWTGETPPPLGRLIEEARGEGYRFLDRLLDAWECGLVRFEHPNEAYYRLLVEGEVVGCGGVATDPYTLEPGVGRVRALYISPSFRRRGYGQALLTTIESSTRFERLRLNTDDAASFYESAGYRPSQEGRTTHTKSMNLGESKAP